MVMRITFLLLMLCAVLPVVGADQKSDARVKEIRTYLRENFGMPGYETTWYKAIKSVRIDADTVVAQVSPTNHASNVCGGISGFVYDRTRSHQLRAVRIEDSKNQVIIHRRSVADPCR